MCLWVNMKILEICKWFIHSPIKASKWLLKWHGNSLPQMDGKGENISTYRLETWFKLTDIHFSSDTTQEIRGESVCMNVLERNIVHRLVDLLGSHPLPGQIAYLLHVWENSSRGFWEQLKGISNCSGSNEWLQISSWFSPVVWIALSLTAVSYFFKVNCWFFPFPPKCTKPSLCTAEREKASLLRKSHNGNTSHCGIFELQPLKS